MLRTARPSCSKRPTPAAAPSSCSPGAREAELSALGVISGFYQPDGIVGDLGGGSLELVDIAGDDVGRGMTLRLGGLALQDLSENSPKKARRIVREGLERAEPLRSLKGRTFYAVGGTWRALARLHQADRGYPLRVMHGYEIDPEEGLRFLELVEEAEATSLKEIEAVSEARRPLLAYGAIVLEEIIRAGRPAEISVSVLGVREGLLYEMLTPKARALDPLIEAADEFNTLRSRAPPHARELRAWTDRFVETAGLPETVSDRRYRHAACLLADIGWRASPDYRGEQSFNLIANAGFVAIDHPGRAYLGALGLLPPRGTPAGEGEPEAARDRRRAPLPPRPPPGRPDARRLPGLGRDGRRAAARAARHA